MAQSSAADDPQRPPSRCCPAVSYLNADRGIKSWLITLDHKRIALMYLVLTTVALFLGGIFAMLLRFEHLTPGPTIMGANTYNRMFTLHGMVMIFLFMIPAIPGIFGNFCLPLMLGAKDVAFPRLNLLSVYVYATGAALALWAMVLGRHRHRLDLLRALQPQHARPRCSRRCWASSSWGSRRSSPASTSSSPSTPCGRRA